MTPPNMNALMSKKRGKKTNKKPSKVSKPLTKAIKKVLQRTSETKYQREDILDNTASGYIAFNSVINTSADWYKITPSIRVGEGSYQRTGNEIEPTLMKLHLNFSFAAADLQTRDIEVYLLCVTAKFQKEYSSSSINGVLSNKYDKFLRGGDGTTEGYTGRFLQEDEPIVHEDFTVLHKKTFRLNKPSGDSNGRGVTAVGAGVAGNGLYCSAPRLSKKITLKFKCPKLKYSTVDDALANNYAPFWAVGYRYLNNTEPDLTGGLLYVEAWSEIYFKDHQ